MKLHSVEHYILECTKLREWCLEASFSSEIKRTCCQAALRSAFGFSSRSTFDYIVKEVVGQMNEKDFLLAVWRCRIVAGFVRTHEPGSLRSSIMSRTESVVGNLL